MAGSSRKTPRVAVLMGGPSSEREVSLSTGRGCASALRDEGYEVIEVDAGPDLPDRLSDIRPDVCFNALHGRWGEDGCVQGLLEWLHLPYTHSGVLASALAWTSRRPSRSLLRVMRACPTIDSVPGPFAPEHRGAHVIAAALLSSMPFTTNGSSVGSIYVTRRPPHGRRPAPDCRLLMVANPNRPEAGTGTTPLSAT